MPELPARPSREYLRKAAKRLARERSLQLAIAQREIARSYGETTWAALMQRVDRVGGADTIGSWDGGGGAAIWAACASDAPGADRIATVRALIDAGANVRHNGDGETPLHAAARRGPLELVELLIAAGALEWMGDRNGRSPADAARNGSATERDAIVTLLTRPVIEDPAFRAAVAAIHSGDVAALSRLLDTTPRLLRERAVEPACYHRAQRHQYFLDPKLFWFVANNPTLTERMAPRVIESTQAMVERGVEQADLDYTLELVMTNSHARTEGVQLPLMQVLLAAGARANDAAIAVTAGHRQLESIRALLAGGVPMTAPVAAALGDEDALRVLLPAADRDALHAAFSLAVINGHEAAVRMTLDAGADIDARLAVHAHGTALHHATAFEHTGVLELLLERGARTDITDTLWDGTALDWSKHGNNAAARVLLERAQGPAPATRRDDV